MTCFCCLHADYLASIPCFSTFLLNQSEREACKTRKIMKECMRRCCVQESTGKCHPLVKRRSTSCSRRRQFQSNWLCTPSASCCEATQQVVDLIPATTIRWMLGTVAFKWVRRAFALQQEALEARLCYIVCASSLLSSALNRLCVDAWSSICALK